MRFIGLAIINHRFVLGIYNSETVSWAGLGASLSNTVATLKKLVLSRIDVVSEVDDPLGDLVPELGMIAGTNIINEIYLDVAFNTWRCRPDTEDWGALDTLLTRPGSFPKLEAVTINILWTTFDQSAENIDRIIDEIMEEDFPRLSDSEVVEFDFECQVHQFI